ncbi:MAG: hypothetical protein JWO36_1220 [Myxococcales bacterium]|nr:hypothetical protein [Myxococcales bacterium]
MLRLPVISSLCLLAACDSHDQFESFDRADLVSDQPGVATIVDPGLVNAWGIAVDGDNQVFIASNGTGQISAFDAGLTIPPGFPLVVPGAAPITGLAFHTTGGFNITGNLGTAPAELITATEDGRVFAFSPSAARAPILVLDLSATGAVFKGLTIVDTAGTPTLLLADFMNNAVVAVDTSFRVITPPAGTGAFRDPAVPANWGPFGIQALGSRVYVTFAEHGEGKDEATGSGLGIVDAFSPDGQLVLHIAQQPALDAPWGLALAPVGFDDFSNDLIVGNFGDGAIHAFDPASGTFLGTLEDRGGNPIIIPGLWGLAFGHSSRDLFFAAGPGDEAHGLFGKLTPLATF